MNLGRLANGFGDVIRRCPSIEMDGDRMLARIDADDGRCCRWDDGTSSNASSQSAAVTGPAATAHRSPTDVPSGSRQELLWRKLFANEFQFVHEWTSSTGR